AVDLVVDADFALAERHGLPRNTPPAEAGFGPIVRLVLHAGSWLATPSPWGSELGGVAAATRVRPARPAPAVAFRRLAATAAATPRCSAPAARSRCRAPGSASSCADRTRAAPASGRRRCIRSARRW